MSRKQLKSLPIRAVSRPEPSTVTAPDTKNKKKSRDEGKEQVIPAPVHWSPDLNQFLILRKDIREGSGRQTEKSAVTRSLSRIP